jgi:hypothetical protein
MASPTNKTHATSASVGAFIAEQTNETVRDDCHTLIELMRELTGEQPRMWGPTIIGFGTYHYQYASGREGDAPLAGFSPRKPELVIYVEPEALEPEIMARLGKHRHSKSCVYVKRLDDIDLSVLKTLLQRSIELVEETYPQAE